MFKTKITADEQQKIYDILVAHAGANEYYRDNFCSYLSQDRSYDHGVEYRFQGKLDFGGKFRVSYDDKWCVDCYPEHQTPERMEIIAKVNGLLSNLQINGFN